MAYIPVAQKFHTVSSTVNTDDHGSAELQSQRTVYTMQDIISTVSYSGGSIDGSGTADTLCYFTDSNTIATFNSYLTNFSNATMKIGSVSAATGANNTAYGVRAMDAVSTGDDNTAVGMQAGNALDSGKDNVLIGKNAGEVMTSAKYNVVVGSDAFKANVLGDNAVVIGYRALENEADSWDNYNVAIGKDAMRQTTTNDGGNTAIGAKALSYMQNGKSNIAVGHECLLGMTNSWYNTVVGYQGFQFSDVAGAGPNHTYNTGLGYAVGGAVTTGIQNTLIGANAGHNGGTELTTGSNNTIIGYGAESSTIGIDNEITLGNSSIATIRAQVTTITALSDERDKKDIVDLDQGLDMVNQLKPRKFVWDHRAEKRYETETTRDEEGVATETKKEVEFYSSRKGTKDIGFIAQELQTVDNEWMQLVSASNPDKLEASYGKLVPVLVKAIQELSAKVTVLENQ